MVRDCDKKAQNITYLDQSEWPIMYSPGAYHQLGFVAWLLKDLRNEWDIIWKKKKINSPETGRSDNDTTRIGSKGSAQTVKHKYCKKKREQFTWDR